MGKVFFWLLLFNLPTISFASENILQERSEVLVRLGAAAGEADSMPPCEAIEHLAAAAAKYDPPKTCPQAKAFREKIIQFERSLQDNCRELSGEMASFLRDPAVCDAGRHQQFRDRIHGLRKKIPEKKPDDEFEEGKGEMLRAECEISLVSGVQEKVRLLRLAEKHHGIADSSMDRVCDPRAMDDGGGWYFEFLDFGEGGRDAQTNQPAG
jgi:hypothetical protein